MSSFVCRGCSFALVLVVGAGLAVPARAHLTADGVAHTHGPNLPTLPGSVLSANPSGYPAGWLDLGLAGPHHEAVADAWYWLEVFAAGMGIESPREELTLARVAHANGETVLRFGQRVGEVPVFRGEVVVVIDEEGRLDDLINGYLAFDRPLAARLADAPAVTAEAMWARALGEDAAAPPPERVFAASPEAPATAFTRLVYLAPAGNRPRLAWEVHPPGLHLAVNWRVFYDAETGTRLLAFNDLRFENEGRVYDPHPGRDGNAEPVLRPLRDREDEAGFLGGPLVAARNCVEDGETVIAVGPFEAELCTEKQVAQADENGDFIYEPDTRAADDLFAEVQMYYHVTEIYAYFQSLGLETVNEVPLPATVNFQIPGVIVGSPNALAPFDNAFFFPAGDILPGVYGRDFDSIVFGQGTNVDFSYDGDVIYHEFGHAVLEEVASTGSFSFDDWGMSAAPGAINEGQADYFAGSFTNDPEIGEYVGPRIVSGTSEARNIRDMSDAASCPTSIIGEVHTDSVHFSGAIWEIRGVWIDELGGEADAFDAAVLTALRRLTAFVTFDQAADFLEDALTDLDPELAEPIETALLGRHVRDCERFVTLGSSLLNAHPLQFLYGRSAISLEPFVPGFVQYRVVVPEGEAANTIAVSFGYGGGGGGNPFAGQPAFPRFAVRRGEPVQVDVIGNQVSGDWDAEITTTEVSNGQRQGLYQVETGLTPGDYYFLPVGTTGSQGAMTQVRAAVRLDDLTPEPEPEPTEDVGTDADEGPDAALGDVEGDTSDGGAVTQAGGDDGGCSCGAAGGGLTGDATWLLALGLIGIRARRRRLT